jgi:hypothetical protein
VFIYSTSRTIWDRIIREYTGTKRKLKCCFISDLHIYYLLGKVAEPLGPRESGGPACFKNLWVKEAKIKEGKHLGASVYFNLIYYFFPAQLT